MKKLLFLALLTAMLFSCSDSGNELVVPKTAEVNAVVDDVNMWGNLVLDIPKDSLYKVGYDNGDIVTISGGSLPEPLDMAFTDKMMSVGTWGMCLTCLSDEATLTIGLANASFCDRVGGKEGDQLTISLKEKGGFRDMYERMKLWNTTNRSDYDSDEMFANFYPVECHGIKSGVVYRSSNPLMESTNPARYEYADRLARNAGINTIITFADTEEKWQSTVASGSGYGEYCNERYSKGTLLFHKLIDDIMDRLPSAVESYLKNKAGLSTGEIDKLRGILSIED